MTTKTLLNILKVKCSYEPLNKYLSSYQIPNPRKTSNLPENIHNSLYRVYFIPVSIL